MSISSRQLLDLRDKISQAKTKKTELEGKQKHLLSELKEKWKCDTIAKAEKKLAELEKEVKTLDRDIETNLENLDKELEIIGTR